MPLLTSFFERLVFLKMNEAPGPILDLFGACAYRAVSAAVRLKVFEVLGQGPLTPDELARRISADPRSVTALLDALVRGASADVELLDTTADAGSIASLSGNTPHGVVDRGIVELAPTGLTGLFDDGTLLVMTATV